MRGGLPGIGVVIATVVAVAACAGPVWAADQTITFPTGPAAGAYSPANVTVDPGDSVTFDGTFSNHPLVWGAGTFPTQSSGATMAYTFTQSGQFAFHCMIHASMVGSVTVSGGGGGGGGGNQLATPDFTWSPGSPVTGQAVAFAPTAFTDPDGSIARYEWDLDGNGTYETAGAAPARAYANAGPATVRLRYVDDQGATSPATARTLTVRAPAGGGPGGGGTTPAPGQPGGAGGIGSPNQPGETGSPPASPGTSTGTPRLRVTARALTFRAGRVKAAIAVARASTVTATLRRGRTTLATGRATPTRAGTTTITLKLTRAGTRALRRGARAVKATLALTARPRGGGAATRATRALSVRRA